MSQPFTEIDFSLTLCAHGRIKPLCGSARFDVSTVYTSIGDFSALKRSTDQRGKNIRGSGPWPTAGVRRVAARLRRQNMALCDAWYAACGKALHTDGRKPHDPEIARELLIAIGASADDWDLALSDETTNDDVKADHFYASEKLAAFGVPILVFSPSETQSEKTVFGPVVVPAPMGDEALALWDLTVAYTRINGLYEMKTPKTKTDLEFIGRVFTPYLEARDWQSIQNPAP